MTTAAETVHTGQIICVRVPQWFRAEQKLPSCVLGGTVGRKFAKAYDLVNAFGAVMQSTMCMRCGHTIQSAISQRIGYCEDCAPFVGAPSPLDIDRMSMPDVKAMIRKATAVQSVTLPIPVADLLMVVKDVVPAQVAQRPVTKPAPAITLTKPVDPDKFKVYVRRNSIYIECHGQRNPIIYNACKGLGGGRWNTEAKAWVFPARPITAARVQNTLSKLGLDCTDSELQKLIEEATNSDVALRIKNTDPATLTQPIGLKHSLWNHQLLAHSFAMLFRGCGLFMEMGTGKAQPLSAPVLTPTGWKRMGDIHVGDAVINSEGKSSRVLGTYPQGVKPIFKVSFSDGTSTRATGDHLWQVNSPSRKFKGMAPRVLTTDEIAAMLRDGAGNCKHYIPLAKPAQFEKHELPIEPYLLGVLLGDGGMSVDMGVYLTNPDDEIVSEVSRLLPDGVVVKRHVDRGIAYRLTRSTSSGNNPMIDKLRGLGLMGHKSLTKFIPAPYMLSSVEDRVELLQGLLDTDGYADKGGHIEFCTSSPGLMRGMMELVQSLGGTATTKIKQEPTYMHNGEKRIGQPSYRVNIALPNEIEPFRLTRKAERVVKHTKYHPSRAIVSVEPDGEEEAQCIAVDATDHLYITDHYILTHNTLLAISLIAQRRLKKVLIVCPKSVIDVWEDEFKKHAAFDHELVLLNKKGMPTNKKVAEARERMKDAERRGVPVIVVANYETAIRPPMGPKYIQETHIDEYGRERLRNKLESPGFIADQQFDMIVADEAHKLMHHTSLTSRVFGFWNPTTTFRLALTGTPLGHDPLSAWGIFRFINPDVFPTSFTKFRSRYAHMGGFQNRQVLAWQNLDELHSIIAQHSFQVTKDVLDLPPQIHSPRYGSLSKVEWQHYTDMEEELQTEVLEKIVGFRGERMRRNSETDTVELTPEFEEFLSSNNIKAPNVLAKLMKLAQIASGFISDTEEKVIHDIGTSKLDLLSETLDEIDPGEPLVIFARFTHNIQAIKELMRKRGVKVAELSGHANELRAWQRGEYTAIVVQVQSGGVGVDLTRCGDKSCHHCIYFTKDYNWVQYEQSLSRAHRPGQTETTYFIHLIMKGTIDEEIEDVLNERGNLVTAVLSGKSISRFSKPSNDTVEAEDDGEEDDGDGDDGEIESDMLG